MYVHVYLCIYVGYGLTALDDCKFHECVDLTDFERERIIVIRPPHGEVRTIWNIVLLMVTLSQYVCITQFTAMSYCISREIPYGIPFQLVSLVNVVEESKWVDKHVTIPVHYICVHTCIYILIALHFIMKYVILSQGCWN